VRQACLIPNRSSRRLVINYAESVWHDVELIRQRAPLVHNITNFVVMNTTANALLALGASPVMAHALEEVEEMAGIAGALVLNIGTLSPAWVDAMVLAGRQANRKQVPVVIDPVGAGATNFRNETMKRLLAEVRPAVIRGNASEIRALYYAEQGTKGVDSTHTSEQALDAARALAGVFQCVVCISGETDVIVAPQGVIRVSNGNAMMPRVTGLGCTATALIGAFAAVNPSAFHSTAHAMAVMGIAGEMAAEHSPGPGSLQVHFLDALYQLQAGDIESRLRLSEE
jgi:hydroxyethylthiazole kinase